MKIRKFTQREKLISYATIGVILIVLVANFIIAPLAARIFSINEEIEKKGFLLGKQSGLIDSGEDIVSLYENYRTALEQKGTPEEIVSNLFENIEKVASSSGIKVKKVKPFPVKDNDEYKEVPLEVDLEGDFAAMFKFVNKLEVEYPLIKIGSLRLVPQSSSSRVVRCRLSLSQIFF